MGQVRTHLLRTWQRAERHARFDQRGHPVGRRPRAVGQPPAYLADAERGRLESALRQDLPKL